MQTAAVLAHLQDVARGREGLDEAGEEGELRGKAARLAAGIANFSLRQCCAPAHIAECQSTQQTRRTNCAGTKLITNATNNDVPANTLPRPRAHPASAAARRGWSCRGGSQEPIDTRHRSGLKLA